MTPPEEGRLWATNGDGDFELIEACLRGGVKHWNLLCFHAQQGTEKYVKGFLISRNIVPPRTHNLTELLFLAQNLEPALGKLTKEAALLNPYAVVERYNFVQLPEAKARGVIAAGQRIRDAIRPLL